MPAKWDDGVAKWDDGVSKWDEVVRLIQAGRKLVGTSLHSMRGTALRILRGQR